MTVCVSVKVHDCIVFAADSAATLTDQNGTVHNVYNNADKVFNLHRNLPVAAMTCGMGHIEGRSISNLAKEFRRDLMSGDAALDTESYTVEQIVEKARQFFEDKYQGANPSAGDALDLFIGGYGSTASHGEVWKVSIVGGKVVDPVCLQAGGDAGGIDWGGQSSAISRLLLGVDPRAVEVLQTAGIDSSAASAIFDTLRGNLQSNVASDPMPTIDAVRLAEFLVDVTKGFFSFVLGANIVGGPTDVATVTKWEGFKWIKRKHFYPEEINRSQNDHVC